MKDIKPVRICDGSEKIGPEAIVKRVAIETLLVSGCHECPHRRWYNNDVPGCIFLYGTLPKIGFPEWCPLKEEDA